MGHVISVINMKGGVGKTTLCIGIGEYLAHYERKKVLFIDLDPQFNATQSMMNYYNLEEKYLNYYSEETVNITVKRLFEMPTVISKKPVLPKKEDIIVELDEYISIIPGTINLIFEDNNKNSSTSRRVKKFIDDNKLLEEYDFIFIDCPPTISLYTDAALIASDFYLVPNKVDRYSILGIKLLDQVINRLAYEESLEIKPLGIVYTMLDTNLTVKTKEIMNKFEKSEIVNNIGLFENSTHIVRDLLVGYKGNISSKYRKSRTEIAQISSELKRRIQENE